MVYITEEEYDALVEQAEEVERVFWDEEIMDMKKKFIQRNDFPLPEDLVRNHVADQLEKFLPYLVYYAEVFEPKKEEEKEAFAATHKAIHRLLRYNLFIGSKEEIEEEKRLEEGDY